jgi:hypothetical protein
MTGNGANVAVKGTGGAVAAIVVAALAWLSGRPLTDPALVALAASVNLAGGVAFVVIYQRYAGILARRTPHARERYDALRRSLAAGGLAAGIYARRLTATLDAVDRFFGDAGMADRTLFPHAFGLRTPAPLWTAASFDRCLVLALVYPIAAVFTIWAISSHVGPAEHALQLPPDIPGWRRVVALAAFGAVAYPAWRFGRASRGTAKKVWGGVLLSAVAVAVAFDFAVAFAFAGAVVVALAVAFYFTRAGVGAGASAFAVAVALAGAVAGPVAFAVAAAIAVAVGVLDEKGRQGGWIGPFQAALLVVLAVACLAAAGALGQSEGWPIAGALLLFLGLLTVVNAPFDWASLGLTRALLRRGLELGAWWPYALALADGMIAAGIIALLTIVAVISVQAFDTLAVFSGGERAVLLPLNDLFDGIATKPAAAEFWWVYAMLLSTMIPSLLNLMIGGASLLRGIPWLTALLLNNMPDRRAPDALERTWMALLLTLQMFVGGLLGIAAQGVLAVVVIAWLLPVIGFDLLDVARGVADANLPAQVMGWFGLAAGR